MPEPMKLDDFDSGVAEQPFEGPLPNGGTLQRLPQRMPMRPQTQPIVRKDEAKVLIEAPIGQFDLGLLDFVMQDGIYRDRHQFVSARYDICWVRPVMSFC